MVRPLAVWNSTKPCMVGFVNRILEQRLQQAELNVLYINNKVIYLQHAVTETVRSGRKFVGNSCIHFLIVIAVVVTHQWTQFQMFGQFLALRKV